MRRPVIYLAHPLSGDFEANRASARRWGCWLAKTFNVAMSADWIWMSEQLEETPENRAMGLDCDKAHIEVGDAMILCGARLSDGMLVEQGHADWNLKPQLRIVGWELDNLTPDQVLAIASFVDVVRERIGRAEA